MDAQQQLSQVVTVLRQWRHGKHPADKVLSDYFASRKQMGSRDRRMVGDCFFALLRLLRRIDRSLDQSLENCPFREGLHRAVAFPCDLHPNDRVWANPGEAASRWSREDDWIDFARCAFAANSVQPGRLKDAMPTLRGTWPIEHPPFDADWIEGTLSRALEVFVGFANETRPARLGLRASIPENLWGQMGYGLAPKELPAFADALAGGAPPAIRIRRGERRIEAAMQALEAEGVAFEPGRLAERALLLERRLPRGGIAGLKEGDFEYQDEGSQFLTELLAPSPGQIVIDACAGGGGKTLHLAEHLGGGEGLHAHEPDAARRSALEKRLERAGVAGVRLVDGPAAAPPADLVFIDAPCSGTGTVRRSPDLKWRTALDGISGKVRLQAAILREWADAVKPGGRLAYATCSLLPEENGHQIRAFLADRKDFRLEPPPPAAAERKVATREGFVQIFPHQYGTDGFFLAVLQRR